MSSEKLEFRFDWEPAEPVRSPELRATWARLEIWVGSECITQVEDVASESVRRSIYGSLYPLAEWIAYNWWFLRTHSRPASLQPRLWSQTVLRGPGSQLYRWLEHHNLRAAGEGFSWPDLTILPEGRHTRLVWHADEGSTAHRPVRFIRSGETWIERDELEGSLARPVDAVITRLSEEGVRESALTKEWQHLRQSDPEEVEFCLAAARLGLDPFSEALEVQDAIERAAARLSGELLDDFLDAVAPTRIDAGLEWTVGAIQHIEHSQLGDGSLASLRAGVAGAAIELDDRPWRAGWDQAKRVRRILQLTPEAPFDFDDLMRLRSSDSHDQGLQAVGGPSRERAGLLVLGQPSTGRQSRRFIQARALWHFLYGPSRDAFLITAAHADRQRTERAFAAELLAPADGIADQLDLSAGEFALDDIDTIAEHFDASPVLVRHQIENQLLQ
jgi:hypothetical protein